MNIYFRIYTTGWIALCVSALTIYILNRKVFVFSCKKYWAFLTKPWKIITFIIAATLMTVVAPYSGDFTWDYYDAFFMSVLTFISAPWAVGIFYKFSKRKCSWKQPFVAFCVWMFSVSWSYDIYIYLRDGNYPPTWWPNIILSSILYASAGLLWNIDWKQGKGIYLSFKEKSWPERTQGLVFPKIFIATLPFMLVAAILCGLVIYG